MTSYKLIKQALKNIVLVSLLYWYAVLTAWDKNIPENLWKIVELRKIS